MNSTWFIHILLFTFLFLALFVPSTAVHRRSPTFSPADREAFYAKLWSHNRKGVLEGEASQINAGV